VALGERALKGDFGEEWWVFGLGDEVRLRVGARDGKLGSDRRRGFYASELGIDWMLETLVLCTKYSIKIALCCAWRLLLLQYKTVN